MRNDAARFWSHVDKTGGPKSCWPWLLSRHPFGYGYFRVEGRTVTAHRFALTLEDGPRAPTIWACHRCNNPPCCNPAHLYWGTGIDNHRDAVTAGHHRPPPHNGQLPPIHVGEANPNSVMTAKRVLDLRSAHEAGSSYSVLAERFGISKPTVAQIVRRKTWRDI